jgi:hypothetical protein
MGYYSIFDDDRNGLCIGIFGSLVVELIVAILDLNIQY